MFLLKQRYYIDTLSNLYTKPVTNCGFVISDESHNQYNTHFGGEFNLTNVEDLTLDHFSYEKFVLFVDDHTYIALYNTLVENLLIQYPVLEQFKDAIKLGIQTHCLMDMKITSIHDETLDLPFQLLLHEISFEFLIPIIACSNIRVDRLVKTKLDNFVNVWFDFMVYKTEIKYAKYLISQGTSQLSDFVMVKNNWEYVFNSLITLFEQSSDVIGDTYYDLVFLKNWKLINKDYNKLIDFLSNNVVRFLSSNNYKYNEWLVEILFKQVSNERNLTAIQ